MSTRTVSRSRRKPKSLSSAQREHIAMFLRRLLVIFACTVTVTTFWDSSTIIPVLLLGQGIHLNTLCGMLVGTYIATYTL